MRMDFATEDLPKSYDQLLVLTRMLVTELKDGHLQQPSGLIGFWQSAPDSA